MKLHENFAPVEGIINEFVLTDETSIHGPPGYRVSFGFGDPYMEVRELRTDRLRPLTSLDRSHPRYMVTKQTAVALAVQILSAYAPEKLQSGKEPLEVTNHVTVPSHLSNSNIGRFLGGYVNFVLGQRSPTVAFSSKDAAVPEALRLLSKVPLPGAVFTAKIEHAAGSSIHIERHG